MKYAEVIRRFWGLASWSLGIVIGHESGAQCWILGLWNVLGMSCIIIYYQYLYINIYLLKHLVKVKLNYHEYTRS